MKDESFFRSDSAFFSSDENRSIPPDSRERRVSPCRTNRQNRFSSAKNSLGLAPPNPATASQSSDFPKGNAPEPPHHHTERTVPIGNPQAHQLPQPKLPRLCHLRSVPARQPRPAHLQRASQDDSAGERTDRRHQYHTLCVQPRLSDTKSKSSICRSCCSTMEQ